MTGPKATAIQPLPRTSALVFIVDDEPMLLELATVMLEPLGYKIRTFRDPATALEAFARAQPRPDLVITDYAMDGINGMELIQECRRLEPRQKILLLSGTVGTEIFRLAADKPNEFLAKPYQARQLVDLVRSMVLG